MTKQTQFTKTEVRIEKGLSLGAELDEGMIFIPDWVGVAIKSTTFTVAGWSTLNLATLAAAQGGYMPPGAYAAVLDVAVNDSGAAGGPASLGFATPGIIVAGKTQYAYCPPAADRVGSRTIIVPISKDGVVAFKETATGGATGDYVLKLLGWLIGGTDSPAVELPYVDLKAKLRVNHP